MFVALAVAGCSSNEVLSPTPPPPGPPPVELASGGITVRVDTDARDLALVRGDTVLLDFPADALELGVVPELDDAVNYDPYPLVVPNPLDQPPTGLAFLAPTSMKVGATTRTSLTIALEYPRSLRASLTIEATRAGSFHAVLTPAVGTPRVAYVRLRPRADATEGFYGLGATFGEVNQRGRVRGMQIEIDSTTESGYNNEHVPIPFLIGTRGWGLFVESAYPGVFSVATNAPDLIEATFGTGLASTQGLGFHLFGEAHPLDVTRHYYEVTGFPRVPARWALGPWVWRHVASQDEAAMDLQTLRDLDLATTGFWLDDGYFSAVGSFDWDPTKFTDAQALVSGAHDLGYAVALWSAPYLDKLSPTTASLRAAAQAKGYYPPVAGIVLEKNWSPPIDYTNPDAYAWWKGLVQTYTQIGIEGFKLDYAEDVVPGITSARDLWKFADGSDERTMHARYQLFYHRVYADTLPQAGGFLLCRHGTFGDQANVSVIWPGDLDSTFAKSGDPAPAGYGWVGGLPASLSAGLALGPSGFPFYGADTGGYLHQRPTKEVMTRWFEQTALSTVMQIYADARPWVVDPTTGYDAEMLGWLRTYMRLHLRLFPYIWTYAQNVATDGRAIMRPLGLAHPELGAHPSDTYLFGDALLVAPVMTQGATTRDVLLPAGGWVDWWAGSVLEGGATVTVPAPLGTLPLFLQAGGIVPMLRPTIATMYPTTQPSVDSYATAPGLLWARVAPGSASSFQLFDGTTLSQALSGSSVTLSANGGSEFTSGVMFEIIAMGNKPQGVTDGGSPLGDQGTLAALEMAASGWAYASDVGGTVWVKTGPGSHHVVITR
jgi:alpha-D-xyloside xylohydrolase